MGVLGAGSNAGGGRLVLAAAVAAGVAVVALGFPVALRIQLESLGGWALPQDPGNAIFLLPLCKKRAETAKMRSDFLENGARALGACAVEDCFSNLSCRSSASVGVHGIDHSSAPQNTRILNVISFTTTFWTKQKSFSLVLAFG